MKDYLFLYKEINDRYYNLENYPLSLLIFLRTYFSGDHRYYDENFFNQDQDHGNETIIINDKQHKFLYIFTKDHDPDEHIDDDDLPDLTNEFNSCKISYDNFIEFRIKWLELKGYLPPFAIIYRDDNDWVSCTGFDSKKDMELFLTDHTQTIH